MKYPKPENLIIFLLLAITLVVIFAPTVIGGKVIFERGVLSFHHPAYAFLSKTLNTVNSSILWNSGYLSGFPIYLSQVGFFHPFNILYKFFNSFTLYGWLIFLNFLLGLIITYIFARNLNLSKISSWLVAFSYVFCHWYLNIGQLNIFANLIPIFPLILLSVVKISQKKSGFIFVGILALVTGLLSCDTQDMFYLMIIAFFFAVVLDSNEYNRQIGFFRNFPTVKRFLIVSAVSFVLISFWLLPNLQFIKLTTRGINPELAKDNLDIGTFVRFFYPHFYFRYLTDRTPIFIGVLSLLLAIACFLLPKKNKIIKFFIILVVLIFLFTLKYSPLAWLNYRLPILNLFRLYGKLWLFADFALIILAGFALDSLFEIRDHSRFKKYAKILKIFGICVLALTIIANFVVFFLRSRVISFFRWFFDKYLYAKTTHAPIEYYHQIITDIFDQTAQVISLANPKFLVALIFTLISIIFLVLYQRGKPGFLSKNFKIIALIILVLNLLLTWKVDDNVRVVVPEKTLAEPPPIARFLQSQKKENEPFRFNRFVPDLRPVEYIDLGLNELRINTNLLDEFNFETLRPNIGVIYGLDCIEAHEHLLTRRHLALLEILGSAHVTLTGVEYSLWDELSKDSSLSLQDRFDIFQSEENRNLLSMMNVKYVVSPFKFPSPWKKVFETVVQDKNASVPAYVYENPDVLPRIYFAEKVKFVASDEKKAYEALLSIKNFKEETLIECSDCNQGYQNKEKDLTKDEISVKEIKDGYLKVVTKANSPRWLIYSESNLPTWEIRINGNLSKSFMANYLYHAVLVPKGENEIEFKYPGPLEQFSYAFKKLIGKEK